MQLFKYPRTPHLPWSPGVSSDDRVTKSIDNFIGNDIVVTVKMDGENTTLYNKNIHARSVNSSDHESRHWIKSFWSQISYFIPEGWRICGENLYAKHTIPYTRLPSYFLAFSIWNENNVCIDWNSTLTYCNLWNVETVPVIFIGRIDNIDDLQKVTSNIPNGQEGCVVRIFNEFRYEDFGVNVAKYVKKEFSDRISDTHWMYKKVVPNKTIER